MFRFLRAIIEDIRCLVSRGGWHLPFELAGTFLVSASLCAAEPAPTAANRPNGTPRLRLFLPTANDALFRGDMAGFYQYIERNFHDQVTYPWEGGQYGFVRDPVDSPIGTIYTRFHEGIDIKALQRDARGEPLDDVMAIADGKIVHASTQPGASNYGRYVVIEHIWDHCPYYSLYAHLSEIVVHEGATVHLGEKIARMGHTGEGIDRARSHVHLEINLMLNTNFDRLVGAADPGDSNKHGNYNGLNLAGFDVARFFLELQKNPDLSVPEFLAEQEIYFKALVPAGPLPPDLLRLYPWMGNNTVVSATSAGAGTPAPAAALQPASWEISFDRSGLPLKVLPTPTVVKAPVLSFVKPSVVPYWEMTHRLVSGSGAVATLSFYGQRLATLIGHAEPSPATPVAGADTVNTPVGNTLLPTPGLSNSHLLPHAH